MQVSRVELFSSWRQEKHRNRHVDSRLHKKVKHTKENIFTHNRAYSLPHSQTHKQPLPISPVTLSFIYTRAYIRKLTPTRI